MKINTGIILSIGIIIGFVLMGIIVKNETLKIALFTLGLSLFIATLFLTVFKKIGHKKTVQQFENDLKE